MTAPQDPGFVSFTRFVTQLGHRLRPGQLAFSKVAYDGLEPRDIEGSERDLARRIFGDCETIPDSARAVLAKVKGRDGGGTFLAALRLLYLGVTLRLERLGQAELAYCFFGAPKLRLAQIAKRFALEGARFLAGNGDIELEAETADGFTIVRHDGRRVRFECFAASRGGDNTRGVPIIAALLDEAAFYLDEATGVANDRAIFGAIIPRLLTGGQILVVSSPWGPTGLLAEEFRANFGNPVTAIAAHAPTLLMRDEPEIAEMVARETLRSPENARRELGAEFESHATLAWPDYENGFREHQGLYSWGAPFAVLDPGASSDDFILLIGRNGQPSTEKQWKRLPLPKNSGMFPENADFERDEWGSRIALPQPTGPLLRIVQMERWTPERIRVVGIRQVVRELAAVVRPAGIKTLLTDQASAPYLAALASEHGLALRSFALNAANKHEGATLIRTLFRDDQLSIALDSPHTETCRRQCGNYRRLVMPGGTYKYTGGTSAAVDDFPAALLTLGIALLDERGTPTSQTYFNIDGSFTQKRLGGQQRLAR